jgi:hypothetical protein
VPNVTYPLDLTGVSPANLVNNEIHTVAESQYRDYYFIVPIFSPFYIDNFSISYTFEGSTRALQENVDYSFALPYVAGVRATGKAMYGAITLHNLNMNGILSITYQTVGGDQLVDRYYVLSELANKAYNPRITIWDVVTNAPDIFPPTPHYQDYDQFYGQEEVVTALGQIRDALANYSTNVVAQLDDVLRAIGVNGLSDFLKLSGGTLTGSLYLKGDPVAPTEAATKNYIDSNFLSNITANNTLSNYVTNASLTDTLDQLRVYVDFVTSNSSIYADLTQFKKYVEGILSTLDSSTSTNLSTKADITYVDAKYADLLERITYLEAHKSV